MAVRGDGVDSVDDKEGVDGAADDAEEVAEDGEHGECIDRKEQHAVDEHHREHIFEVCCGVHCAQRGTEAGEVFVALHVEVEYAFAHEGEERAAQGVHALCVREDVDGESAGETDCHGCVDAPCHGHGNDDVYEYQRHRHGEEHKVVEDNGLSYHQHNTQ